MIAHRPLNEVSMTIPERLQQKHRDLVKWKFLSRYTNMEAHVRPTYDEFGQPDGGVESALTPMACTVCGWTIPQILALEGGKTCAARNLLIRVGDVDALDPVFPSQE